MKRWKNQKSVRLDEKEFKTHLGNGNFIFVGSSCDMFAPDIPSKWIERTITHCELFKDNSYLFQSKNPRKMGEFILPQNTTVCTTIETNRWYGKIMGQTPAPDKRAQAIGEIDLPKFITIEPILDFDVDELLQIIQSCDPQKVILGADSGRNNLPEPDKIKIEKLIGGLLQFTKIEVKQNLTRLTNIKIV
jgi:DNA repair photolyase